MRSTALPLDRDRTLTLTTEADLDAGLCQGRIGPLAVLVTGQGLSNRLIQKLLHNGCEYFVCFGPESEAAHDRIDEVVEGREQDERPIITTWHADETATDVAEFFVEVAGRGATHLIAVLGPSDHELKSALTELTETLAGKELPE